MENIEKDKTLEDLSVDGTPETESTAGETDEKVDSIPDQAAESETVETEEAVSAAEEIAEEAVEESAEESAEEETVEELATQAEQAEVPTKLGSMEKLKKTLPVEPEKLISLILGGVGILFVIALFIRLFAFGLTADAFQYGLLKMNVWDTLKAGLGENAFGVNNSVYFSLVLAMYVFPMLVAFGAGVTCLVRSLYLILGTPKEKTTLTEPMIYSAAGIYGLLSYVAIMNVIAGFCMKDFESCRALFSGAFEIAVIAGIASLLQRVIRQATVERVMKAKFHAKAEVTSERLVRREIIKNPTALTALVHRNVLFYVTYGLMAAAVLGILFWLITAPVAAGVYEGGVGVKSFIENASSYQIKSFKGFGFMIAGICLMISLISLISRLAFRAVDFLGTRLAFGASAQDRYEFAKFLGVFWRRLIYTMIFAAAYAALAPGDFEIGNIITAVLPYAILMVCCIVLRIIYAILVCNLKYETLPAALFEEAPAEELASQAEEAVEEVADEATEEVTEELASQEEDKAE